MSVYSNLIAPSDFTVLKDNSEIVDCPNCYKDVELRIFENQQLESCKSIHCECGY